MQKMMAELKNQSKKPFLPPNPSLLQIQNLLKQLQLKKPHLKLQKTWAKMSKKAKWTSKQLRLLKTKISKSEMIKLLKSAQKRRAE